MKASSTKGGSLTELFRPNNPRGLGSKNLSSARLDLLKKEISTDLHIIPLKELFELLKTDPVNGLTKEQAAEALKFYGPNTLTPATQISWLQVLIKSMCTGFSVLIWIGAFLCFIAFFIEGASSANPNYENLYLGCILAAVDIFSGLFSFFQNYRSSKIMSTFKKMLPPLTSCIREGQLHTTMPVRDIVRGDLVAVSAGDIVPADIRIIDSKGFKVDNSSLTGESVAVARCNADGTVNILESPNVAFFSTQCVEGWARGVAICCGDLTALGRVAGLAARLQPDTSPLARELRRFMRAMCIIAIVLGVFIAVSSLALGYPFIQTIIFVIGIMVANVPEGLQPTVTAALTLTAQQMVKKNCLVKNLEAVEALGACTTICSDKTGTLTMNLMKVRSVWLWDRTYSTEMAFTKLKLCGILCSTAKFLADGRVAGDASETAILKFLGNIDDPVAIRNENPKVAEIPFNSINKYQVSVHLNQASSKYVVVMKGAPENILNRCSTVMQDKGERNIDTATKETINNAIESLANTGARVLAFAEFWLDPKTYPQNYKFDSDNVNFPIEGLRFLGLLGLIDPPREGVLSAILRVRRAGVRVMMVTGDHPGTARAIAAEVGLVTDPSALVLTGDQLRDTTNDLLDRYLAKHYEIVFARTSPTQKLQIVEACQRSGAVVAVTGDGVNDAPALRKADIGISMGITGSQVSKKTADIILLDDNFATIVTGIEEGRKIFDNLKKCLTYILISNIPEIFPVLMFILFSIPLPLGVMTILCVDLGTDMWPAVALAHESAESDVMSRPPRSGDALMSRNMMTLIYGHLGLMEVSAGMFAYFCVMAEHGFYPARLFGIREAWDSPAVSDLQDSLGQEWTYEQRKMLERASQASYFIAMVLMQVVNAIICKTRYNSIFHVGMKNRCLNMGLVFELLLACFLCYTPGVNDFFKTYPLRWYWWFLSTPFCVLMFSFDEFRKYCIRRRLFNGWYNKTTYF